jgi:hypothetical protein
MPSLTKPCVDCPFRRVSAPGWLGPWSAEDLLHQIAYGSFPCHKTISGPDMSHDDPMLRQCAGAAIFLNNKMQQSRNPDLAAAQRALKDCAKAVKASVFGRPAEFLTHHK